MVRFVLLKVVDGRTSTNIGHVGLSQITIVHVTGGRVGVAVAVEGRVGRIWIVRTVDVTVR